MEAKVIELCELLSFISIVVEVAEQGEEKAWMLIALYFD